MTKYIYSVGRRKTASAQVKLFQGEGESTINGKELSTYIHREDLFDVVFSPLKLCRAKTKFYFEVKVSGSGESSQVDAIKHGLSIALSEYDKSYRTVLKKEGFLTRDARKVERKKPGLHKARKAIQWSKR